jgi:hypothetical protein
MTVDYDDTNERGPPEPRVDSPSTDLQTGTFVNPPCGRNCKHRSFCGVAERAPFRLSADYERHTSVNA